MQIFLSKNSLTLFLLVLSIFFACGASEKDEEVPTEQPAKPDPLKYGTVSGIVSDAGTKNPIPGATVTLLDREVKTEIDGMFTFQEIPYTDTHTLTVNDPDYKTHTADFSINQERLVINVELIPQRDPEKELNQFLENFSDLLETLDPKNKEAIQALFSETYAAADDPVTDFAVASGVVPTNYENVIPNVTALFENYTSLQFVFKDIKMDITHARKAALSVLLEIKAENAEEGNVTHLEAQSLFEFRREGEVWKIIYWQVLQINLLQ